MSTVKVNKIDKRTGSTLELGGPGTAVTLACGATQTGFGRTGTVDWCTTAKTSPFTAVSGNGYFVNTTSGAVTVTLPASPSAGDIVSIADYTNTFQTNNVTIGNNSSKIGGICANATLSTEGQSATFVYVDGTEGWKNVQDSTSNITGATFMAATGGTVTTDGNFKVHTFTSDATFCVSSLSNQPANNEVSYIVVAGGGGGGSSSSSPSSLGGGGGGAGGFRENKSGVDSYTASPLNGAGSITVTATGFPITIGGGGAGNPMGTCSAGSDGANSVFSTITSAGGGGGATRTGTYIDGRDGGSGGGGAGPSTPGDAGLGNTPPVSPPQGNPGAGKGPASNPLANPGAGGGGGATQAGIGSGDDIYHGGDGATTGINGSSTTYAGGGGGGNGHCGGAGGGGNGGGPGNPGTGQNGTANTGGGGGGTSRFTDTGTGGSGGSGVVIIRYKFQ